MDDSTGNILNKGVVIFPDGIDPAKDSLETPAATRRAARMGRRLKFRRKIRKWHLLKILIETGMCPLRMEELEAWKKDGKYPLNNQAFLDWLKATDLSNIVTAMRQPKERYLPSRSAVHFITFANAVDSRVHERMPHPTLRMRLPTRKPKINGLAR